MDNTTNQGTKLDRKQLDYFVGAAKMVRKKKATHSSGFFVIVPISIPVSMLSAMFEKN